MRCGLIETDIESLSDRLYDSLYVFDVRNFKK